MKYKIVAHGLHREHEWEPNSALMLEVIIGTRDFEF